MTKALHELQVLVSAVDKLHRLPVAQLAENKKLIGEMSSVLNARGIGKLLDAIRTDYVDERNDRFRTQQYTQDDNFLQTFAQFKNDAFSVLAKNATTFHTEPMNFDSARALNSKAAARAEKEKRAEIKTLKSARAFGEVFNAAMKNSIYSDASLQINTPRDPTRLRSYIDYSPYLYNYAYYLGIPTLSRLNDRPLDLATKKAPKIKMPSQAATDLVKKIFARENIYDITRDMLFFSALSPRGSLIVPILQGGKIRFNVFNDTQFTYGMTNTPGDITARYSKTRVGYLYCMGSTLTNGVSAHFNCPGFEPLYAIGKNKLFQLKEAAEALNIYIYTIKVLCVRAQILIQKYDGEGQTDTMLENMKRQLQTIARELSLSTPITQPEGAQLDILNNNISPGFADVAPVLKEFTGLLSGLSPDYFFGSTTAYAANSFNIATTNENINAEIQKPQLEPAFRFIVNTYLAYDSRFAAYKSMIDDFEIEFESIYEETEQERADIAAKKIDNIVKMSDSAELEEIFKAENLLDKKYTFANLQAGGDGGDGDNGDAPDGVPDTDTSNNLGANKPPGRVPG